MRSTRSTVNALFKKNGTSANTLLHKPYKKLQMSDPLVDMYKRLSIFVDVIQRLLGMFSTGHFFDVAALLTQSVYESLSVYLNSLAADPVKYPDYENIRLGIVMTLEGLYQGIRQYAVLVNTEHALTTAQECCDTLHNAQKLKEYLDLNDYMNNFLNKSDRANQYFAIK